MEKKHRFIKLFGHEESSWFRRTSDASSLDVNDNVKSSSKYSSPRKFEYENIPRIDVNKFDKRSTNDRSQSRQSYTTDYRQDDDSSSTFKSEIGSRNQIRPYLFDDPNRRSYESYIHDYYDTEALTYSMEQRQKMETIDEEKQTEASKLSVREILKRFEELGTQKEQQTDERSSDRTLNTIQETLKKLDEKVKSYQVYKTLFHKIIKIPL